MLTINLSTRASHQQQHASLFGLVMACPVLAPPDGCTRPATKNGRMRACTLTGLLPFPCRSCRCTLRAPCLLSVPLSKALSCTPADSRRLYDASHLYRQQGSNHKRRKFIEFSAQFRSLEPRQVGPISYLPRILTRSAAKHPFGAVCVTIVPTTSDLSMPFHRLCASSYPMKYSDVFRLSFPAPSAICPGAGVVSLT